jgi:hypothetical protein
MEPELDVLAVPTLYVATRPDGGADLVTAPPATVSRAPRPANVFGQRMQGTVNVDLACAGTGTASVWIQDQSGESDAGPPTLLDCANPRLVRLTSTISGSDFFVYAKLDPNTVAVLAYLPSISISVEDHEF